MPTKSEDLPNIMSSNGIGIGLFDESNCHYVDLDNTYTCSDFNNKNNFNVMHLNVHSITAKHSQLIEMLNYLSGKCVNMHALLLCETFMNQLNINESYMPEYDKYVNFKQYKGRGGVGMYVCIHILRQDLTINHNDIFESCYVELKINKTPIIAGEIYHAPNSNEQTFLHEYNNILNILNSGKRRVILGTDQNLNYLKLHVHTMTKKLLDLNLEKNTLPTICLPTRVTYTTVNLIDNIYSSQILNDIRSGVILNDMSDHYPCIDSVNLGKSTYKRNKTV